MQQVWLGTIWCALSEIYTLTGQVLGRGAYATVVTCVSLVTGKEYAAKVTRGCW